MNNIATFTAVRRTSRPKATVQENDSISVRVNINVEPDGHWERFFGEQQGNLWMLEKARVIRRDRNAHPGVVSHGPGIRFRIRRTDELADVTAMIDELIDATNRHYSEFFVPAEREKAEAERRREEARAVTQAELDRIAADLLPPGGEEPEAKRVLPEW
jgi:hypothetical protein